MKVYICCLTDWHMTNAHFLAEGIIRPIRLIAEDVENVERVESYEELTPYIEAIKKIDSDYIITTRDFHNELVGKYAKEGIIKIATEHNHHNNDCWLNSW